MYECVISIWERCVEIVPDSSLIDVMNRVIERLQAGDGPGAVEIQRWGGRTVSGTNSVCVSSGSENFQSDTVRAVEAPDREIFKTARFP